MKKPGTVAIIGAGIGGLTAGNLLARRGRRVVIFESQPSPGGYTAGFTRRGFYFESGTLAFESSAVLFKMLDDLELREAVPCVRMKFRDLSPHFDFTFDSTAAFKEALYRGFPADREALDGYFRELDPIVEVLRPFMGRPYPMQFRGWRAMRATIPYITAAPRLMRVLRPYRGMTVDDLAAKYFRASTPLRRLFNELGYPKMSIASLAGFFLVIAEDYWHVRDGMQSLAEALARRFAEAGGELRLKTPVEKIVTKSGAAAGVLAGGERFEAGAVISACDYKTTFLRLLDDPALVPRERLDRIRDAAVSEGIFTVYLGLKMPGPELEARLKAPMLSFHPLAADIDHDDPGDIEHFRKAPFSAYSPSLVSPRLAPEGMSSLMIQAMCPTRWQADWHRGDPEKYRALKMRVRDELIDRVETLLPGLKAKVEFADAATPLTYERYTGNSGGATSAWSWNPRKAFYEGGAFRTTVDTPVPGLLIGSCWAGQIGGIPNAVAAAYLCARKLS